MEIYLKNRNRKQFVCILKQNDKTVELDVFHSSYSGDFDISLSNYDESINERHSWFSAQTENTSINGKWQSVKAWQQSTKEEFMEAYASAKNSLHSFQLSINPK